MRLIPIFLILAVIVLGALFAAINGARVPIDLYFTDFEAPVGVTLLGAMLVGWLLGGLVAWFGQVPRLRRQLRSARRELDAARAAHSGAYDEA